MTNIERIEEARRMVLDIIDHLLPPIHSTEIRRGEYKDILSIPESIRLNTLLYSLWEDVLILYRGLGIEEK